MAFFPAHRLLSAHGLFAGEVSFFFGTAFGAVGSRLSDALSVIVLLALLALAGTAWVVLLKRKVLQQTHLVQDQLRRARAFSELGRQLASAANVEEAARIILKVADDLFGWDACYLNLYSAESDQMETVINMDTVEGRRVDVLASYHAGKPTPMARRVIEQGATILLRDSSEDLNPNLVPFGDRSRLSVSLLFVPIRDSTRIIGLLSIQSYRVRFYDEEKLKALQDLADHCGGALERIRTRAQLQKAFEEMEIRVAQRTAELTRVNHTLKEAREGLEQRVEERTVQLSAAVEKLKREVHERRQAEVRNEIFSRLGRELSAASDISSAGQSALNAADRLVGWEAAYLHLYSADYRFTVPILMFDIVDGRRTQVFGLYREISARDRRIIDVGAELVSGPSNAVSAPLVPFGVRNRLTASRLFVPIHSGGRVIGAMSAQSYQEEAYDEEDLKLLQFLADFCGETLERIQAEQSLRQSEERFSKVFRSSPAPMSLTTLDQGTYLDVNDSLLDFLGFNRDEMLERTSIELNIWPDPDDRLKMAEAVLEQKSLRNFRCQLRRKTGEIRTALASVERLEFRGVPNAILASFHDVTELEARDPQIHRGEQMEAVENLAAGVAHDFNNILTVVQGHLGLLLETENLSADIKEGLEAATTASNRAVSLTQQLLALSRRQVLQIRAAHLNDIIDSAARSLQPLLGAKVRLCFEYGSSLPAAMADAGAIEQAILSLGTFARESMPGGGQLTIGTGTVEIKNDSSARSGGGRAGKFVYLTATDTGPGMDEATRARIFEPFLARDHGGRGPGLALASIQGIVRQHGGWVEVESQPGKGTAFKIFLRATDSVPEAGIKADAPVAPAKKGNETILVVDDEVDLRDLIHALLEGSGYRVLEAMHGKDAKKVWAEQGGRIDLLLTDMMMPEGISGLQLAEEFRKENPALKVIFTSGYSMDVLEQKKVDGLKEGINFLPKPYHPETLSKTVRACLDS